jgi:hypothetical protein
MLSSQLGRQIISGFVKRVFSKITNKAVTDTPLPTAPHFSLTRGIEGVTAVQPP